MSRQGMGEPCTKKLKGMGERDGVLETLLFCAWKRTDRRGYFKVDWHTLNLETREISETLITMPPEVGDGFSAVSCRNHVFVLGGACPMDPSCPDGKTRKIHSHDHVFCFDSDHPDHGWKKAPPMSVPRWRPTAVAAEGKIYAFMGYDLAHFADIFDVSGSGWKLLTPPSDVDMGPLRLSYPVLFDSPRSRILVHFGTHDFNGKYPLYAYYIDDESWQCLNEDFGPWPHGVALVDGLFYCLLYPDVDRDLYCFSNQSCPLEVYDVVENKWLPAYWLSEFSVSVPDISGLYHLGNDHFCLAWYNTLLDHFQYTKISLHKNFGEIHATGLSESIITVPFQKASVEIICIK